MCNLGALIGKTDPKVGIYAKTVGKCLAQRKTVANLCQSTLVNGIQRLRYGMT